MRRTMALAAAAVITFAGQSFGQSTATQREARTEATTTRTAQPSSEQAANASAQDPLQQHIAVALLLGNQEEIALSQLGLQRSQNEQVKQFAQTMIEQHQQAVSKIEQAAPHLASLNLQLTAQGAETGGAARSARSESAGNPPLTTRSADTESPAGERTASAAAAGNQRSGTASAGQNDPTQQMAQYMRDVKQQCLAMTTQELSKKQGAEFDKCFMGAQMFLHTGMLAHLKAAEGRVSNEMQPIVQQGTQMTEHHLAQARTILEQLDAADSPARAAAGQGETQRQ
ncbi:MAG: hypothetical protein DCC67_00550 [Planctomycetota bacterium]|nr:MAG: hypothetical protein DCC67_00550 [Planctomycetota bacterium]